MWYRIAGCAIHGMSVTKRNCSADPNVVDTSVPAKFTGRCSVNTNVSSVTASAAHCCTLPRSGSSASNSAPTSGVNTMMERMLWSKFTGLLLYRVAA